MHLSQVDGHIVLFLRSFSFLRLNASKSRWCLPIHGWQMSKEDTKEDAMDTKMAHHLDGWQQI